MKPLLKVVALNSTTVRVEASAVCSLDVISIAEGYIMLIPLEIWTRLKAYLQDSVPRESGYPSSPIGGDNPYYACDGCGRSTPEINYAGHYDGCEYGQLSEAKKLLDEIADFALSSDHQEISDQ